MTAVRVVDVALDPRNGGAEAVYTYRHAPGLTVGEAVFVPLGPRIALGFVVAEYTATEQDLGFPFSSLRDVAGRVEGLSLPKPLVAMCREVAEETLCPLPVALSAATPPGVRERLVACWEATPPSPQRGEGGRGERDLKPLERETLRLLREQGPRVESRGKKTEAGVARALRSLRKLGLVRHTLRLADAAERRKTPDLLRLTGDNRKVEAFLHKEGRRKPAQALVLMKMQEAEHMGLTAPEIKAMAGVTDATLKSLIEQNLLERAGSIEDAPLAEAPTPNPAQRLAIEAVAESVRTREPRNFLLFGVTGSGKTEVYLRAAAEALKAGRQVLYIVPEIALAAQAISRLRERFGQRVAVLHSDLPDAERLATWRRIQAGDISVVLGARSALFAPLADVGLVIVDEEHEQAYKQETAPRYHAKRVALALGRLHACPVVLGSATPSVESYSEAETERLTLLSLPERAASAKLPDVFVRDLTEGYRAGKPSILCDDLRERLIGTLERGEQAILFLNRRAYAPFLVCRDCGHQFGCPNCSVSLAFHRRDRRLRCHHCGHHEAPPEACPQCLGIRIAPFGIGTEKVEEAIAAEFEGYKVARLDRDVARRKGALEETLADFRAGATQILVGTQMVAKGLDFPNVTLVGVIAADMSLNMPDFRAGERTFQLVSQVAGRAGRGRRPGTVVVQTFNPHHPAIDYARRHDYVGYYENLRAERDEAGYPPFRRLVNVVLSGEDRHAVGAAANEAARRLHRVPDAETLGPVACAVERAAGRWRHHVLVKLGPDASPRPAQEALLGFSPEGVSVVLDVDPYQMM
jgi:primosomal protein N' (replication factor Y)